jgi:hypothetical protein
MTMTAEKNKGIFFSKGWVIVIIILVMSYAIYNGLNDLTESRRQKEQWTEEDRELLVTQCISECGETGVKYPDLARTYCECGNDKIIKKFTKSEYLELVKKPTDEQIKIGKSLVGDCLTEYQNAIKKAEK